MTSRNRVVRLTVGSVLAGEAVVLLGLLVARGRAPRTVPPAWMLVAAIAATALLALGVVALATALRRTRDGRMVAASRLVSLAGIAGTAALGIELLVARFQTTRDPLAAAIVGLHAAHVGAGIALAGWVLALIRFRQLDRRRADVLVLAATYWALVIAVWVFVWPLLTGLRP